MADDDKQVIGDQPGGRQEGPFVASGETTEDGKPVGVEVAGGRDEGPLGSVPRPHDAPADAGPIDETGALDDEGETRNERPRDTADLEDVPASADRDLDLP